MQKLKDSESIASEEIKGFHFSELSIRQAFVRKVYAILLLQLLVTSAIAAVFTFHDGVKEFIWNSPKLFVACIIASCAMVCIFSCSEDARRRHPMNLILLSIFTVVEAVIIGFICSVNEGNHVLIAVCATAAICFLLTIFSLQTKYDFTGWGPYLFVLVTALLLLHLALFLVPHTMIRDLLYSSLGALLFSFIFIHDTQVMIGGKHKYSISPEEHVFAALSLYLDILNIFLSILRLNK